jgi:hypothetical protein
MTPEERAQLLRNLNETMRESATLTPAQAREILQMSEISNVDHKRSPEHAVYDYALPAFVRAKLVMLMLPATESMILREAKIDSPVYAKHDGRACKLTLVSRLGDIGISYSERDMGYDKRGLSIYDLTDFSSTSLF